MMHVRFAFAFLLSFLLLSCTPPQAGVVRLDAEEIIDLSGRWNDSDSKIVAKELVEDLSKSFDRRASDTSEKPLIIVAYEVRNQSLEHINTGLLVQDVREALIDLFPNISFVTSGTVRNLIRNERLDQDIYASADTRASIRRETGADYLLTGSVDLISDTYGNNVIRTYYVVLELIDIESGVIAWTSSANVRKLFSAVGR